MLSRAENVCNAHLDLFGIFDDALLVYVGPSKGDQDGTKHIDHPWHIYSVPEGLKICPVLAFSKYLLTHPHIMNGECLMFDGASQYDRLNALLKEVVHHEDHAEEFGKLGLDVEYFGTHSIRKGSITHGTCGVVNGPPIASICIRANWKMPGIMNRYMRYESAGEEFVDGWFVVAPNLVRGSKRAVPILTSVIVMKWRKHGEGRNWMIGLQVNYLETVVRRNLSFSNSALLLSFFTDIG